MKLRANLFKKNILIGTDTESIDFVESMHHALVDITGNELHLEFSNGVIENFLIQFSEDDAFTSTHIGQFKNGNQFRLIQPLGVSREMAMLHQASKGGFSIGSIDPRGWAIYFFLTEPNDLRDSYRKESEKSKELEKLMRDLLSAFENGLRDKFLEAGKMILPLIESDPMQIFFYSDGEELAYKLKANSEMFTITEQQIIEKIELR
jgi:hypothetical protein